MTSVPTLSKTEVQQKIKSPHYLHSIVTGYWIIVFALSLSLSFIFKIEHEATNLVAEFDAPSWFFLFPLFFSCLKRSCAQRKNKTKRGKKKRKDRQTGKQASKGHQKLIQMCFDVTVTKAQRKIGNLFWSWQPLDSKGTCPSPYWKERSITL